MSAKTKFTKTILFKLLVLLIGSTLAVVTLVVANRIANLNQISILYQAQTKENTERFDAIYNRDRELPLTLSLDYTYWDEMADWADNPEQYPDFPSVNIDPAISTFKADIIRAYNRDGDFLYGADKNPDLTQNYMPDLNLKEVFKDKETIEYFVNQKDIGVFEIYGATIHESDDELREGPDRGYFIVGKLLNNEYADRVSKDTASTVTIINPQDSAKYPTTFNYESGTSAFKKDLNGLNGSTQAVVYVKNESPSIAKLSATQQTSLFINILTYAGLAFLLIFLLLKWIFLPLRKIIVTLNTDDLSNLKNTTKYDSEIGSLATLVVDHAHAQEELAAAKANVEEKVVMRTKELKEEQLKLQASIESLNVGFVMTDAQSQIITINQAAIELLEKNGLTKVHNSKELSCDKITNILFKNTPKLKMKFHHCIESNSPISINEISLENSIVRIFVSPIKSLNKTHAIEKIGQVMLIEDITEEKIMNRSKDEFFSIASHELRTPLTAIRGNSKIVLDNYQNALKKDENLKEIIEDIHGSSVRLIEIVNDFLDVSRLEQGKMQFINQPTDIAELIQKVKMETDPVVKSKNLYLNFDINKTLKIPKVFADQDRAEQVIYNLIGNAINYTETGGITIGMEKAGKYVKVTVTDTGQGISQENQKILFHKFQQANSSLLTRDTTKGTGLGLYISKLLVEHMNGALQLEKSTPNEGSVFSFTLPIYDELLAKKVDKTDTKTDTKTGITIENKNKKKGVE